MKGEHFFYKENGVYYRLDMREVFYIKAESNYVQFYNAGKPILIRAPLQFIMKRLASQPFCQVHRSYAVSLDHIVAIGPDSLIVGNSPPEQIPISKKYYDNLLEVVTILEPGKQGCDSDCDRLPKEGEEVDWDEGMFDEK